MKPRTRLHCAARKARSTLQVGRTPACWKAQVDEKTRKVERTRRLCAWAEIPPLPPKLRPQPVFGSCLENLTQPKASGEEQREESSTKAPAEVKFPWQATAKTPAAGTHQAESRVARQPGRGRSAWQESWHPSRVERGQASRQERLPPVHRSLAPLSLDRRMRADLLARLAGAVRLVSRSTSRPRLGLPWQAAPGGSSSLRRPLPEKAADWLPALVQRLQRTLTQAAARMRPPGAAGDMALSGFTVEQALLPSWEAVLGGPPAPFELLARLAGLPQAETLASPGSTRAGGTPRRTAATGSQQAMQPDQTSAPDRPAAGRQPAILPESTQQEGLAPPRVRGSEFTPLAPPAATVSLPPLAAPQKPYDPTLPVATATLRYGAQREVIETTPEDLNGLAAKIKRILDEEARRQGINVS